MSTQVVRWQTSSGAGCEAGAAVVVDATDATCEEAHAALMAIACSPGITWIFVAIVRDVAARILWPICGDWDNVLHHYGRIAFIDMVPKRAGQRSVRPDGCELQIGRRFENVAIGCHFGPDALRDALAPVSPPHAPPVYDVFGVKVGVGTALPDGWQQSARVVEWGRFHPADGISEALGNA